MLTDQEIQAEIDKAQGLTNEATPQPSSGGEVPDWAKSALGVPTEKGTPANGAIPADRVSEIEASFRGERKGTKLTHEEIFLGELKRDIDPNAPPFKVTPHGYKPPGKFADLENSINEFKTAEDASMFSQLSQSEVAAQLLADLQAKDAKETERVTLLKSKPVQEKTEAIKALIERVRFDDRWNGEEYQSLLNAQLQLQTGDIDRGCKMVDAALLVDKQKLEACHAELAATMAAIDKQREELAAEKARLAALAGIESDEPVYSDPADVEAAYAKWERLRDRDTKANCFTTEQGFAFQKYQELKANLKPEG